MDTEEAEKSAALDIVRALAAEPAPIVGDMMGTLHCALCEAPSPSSWLESGADWHGEPCPWRRAVELTESI